MLNDNDFTYFFFGTNFANSEEINHYPYGLMFCVAKDELNQGKTMNSMSMDWKKYPFIYYSGNDLNKDYMSRDLIGLYHIFYGEYLYNRNKDGMLKEYEIAGRIAYDNEPVVTNIANQLLKKNMLDEALGYYERVAWKIAPTMTSSFYNLGYILDKAGNYELAEKAFKKAIELNINNSNAYGSLGLIYSKINRNNEAISMLTKSLQIDPLNAKAYYNLGVLYANSGLYGKAIDQWQMAVKINPAYTKASENINAVRAIMQKKIR